MEGGTPLRGVKELWLGRGKPHLGGGGEGESQCPPSVEHCYWTGPLSMEFNVVKRS